MSKKNYKRDEEMQKTDSASGNKGSSKNASRNRNRSRGGKRNYVDDRTSSTVPNDADWYFTDETYMRQLSTFSFDQYIGLPFNVLNTEQNVPAFMTIWMAATAGLTDSSVSDGINLAGFRLYTKLSSLNAKTTNYAPQDVTLLLLAIGNLIAYTEFLKSVLKVGFLYNKRNRSMPIGLLESWGIDAVDLFDKLADYRIKFNTILTSLNTLPFPANISYFAKCANIFSHIYMDDESSMAQLYSFVPHSVWIYDDQYNEEGSGLRTVTIKPSQDVNTFGGLLSILEDMRDGLLQSAVLNYVYSDILRLSQKDSIALGSFTLIKEDEVLMPEYSPWMLTMINNLTVPGLPLDSTEVVDGHTPGLDVLSDANKNCIKFNPVLRDWHKCALSETVMNYPMAEPESKLIVDSTRYVALGKTELPGPSGVNYNYLTDVTFPDWAPMSITLDDFPIEMSSLYKHDNEFARAFYASISKFDWAPRFYVHNGTDTDFTILGDLNFFTVVDYDYIRKLNDATFLGLFELR